MTTGMTVEMPQVPEVLGSLNDYIELHGFQDDHEGAHREYSTALAGLRKARALERGISLDELHAMDFSETDDLSLVN